MSGEDAETAGGKQPADRQWRDLLRRRRERGGSYQRRAVCSELSGYGERPCTAINVGGRDFQAVSVKCGHGRRKHRQRQCREHQLRRRQLRLERRDDPQQPHVRLQQVGQLGRCQHVWSAIQSADAHYSGWYNGWGVNPPACGPGGHGVVSDHSADDDDRLLEPTIRRSPVLVSRWAGTESSGCSRSTTCWRMARTRSLPDQLGLQAQIDVGCTYPNQ